jgi:MOSC domain-containing protein YiiM
MKLLSVNIGRKRTHTKGVELETTGIYKDPVSEPVLIETLGFRDDFICDQKNHGGPDQAIFVYGTGDYAWWSRALGRRLDPGTFGENLTITDLESAPVHIGDRLRIGSVLLEVSAARIPCSTLAARMGDRTFVTKYRRAERPGVYCRVIESGAVRAGDHVELIGRAGEAVSVLEMFREHFRPQKDEAMLRALLRAPVSIRARAALEEDLKKLLASRTL